MKYRARAPVSCMSLCHENVGFWILRYLEKESILVQAHLRKKWNTECIYENQVIILTNWILKEKEENKGKLAHMLFCSKQWLKSRRDDCLQLFELHKHYRGIERKKKKLVKIEEMNVITNKIRNVIWIEGEKHPDDMFSWFL